MEVPFVDLGRIHKDQIGAFCKAMERVVLSSEFTNGSDLGAFEREFAGWVGSRHCIGLASGHSALTIGLRSLGIEKGDQVVVPAMTFVGTVTAVRQTGGVAVLVDCDRHGLIDLNQTEERIQEGARFILPVHLFGQLVDPSGLSYLRERYGAVILEDACQAHGATQDGISSGAIGDAAAFSFFPSKNLGAFGDGGALCTGDDRVAERARALREHGQARKNEYTTEGFTARLDTLHAAILREKLPLLAQWNRDRIEVARFYSDALSGVGDIEFQACEFDGRHVYNVFAILTHHRERLVREFQKSAIGYGFHYPVPIHRIDSFKEQPWYRGSFPNAERFSDLGISLPMFPGITREELSRVVAVIRSVFID